MADAERRVRSLVDWATIAGVVLALMLAATSAFKTMVINDYRIEQLEKDLAKIDTRLDDADKKIAHIEQGYGALLNEARRHGWKVDWE